MQVMTNNLDAMIGRSGLSKKEVAALKGVTPETLSRQIHGKIQMTLADAERYAKILSCSPMDVIFPWTPIPIIGACRMESKNGSDWVQRILLNEQEMKRCGQGSMGVVNTHNPARYGQAAVIWEMDEAYGGAWSGWANSIELVMQEPIEKGYVPRAALLTEVYAKCKCPVPTREEHSVFITGILHSQPGNKYTIDNPYRGETYTDLELEWATQITAHIFLPDAEGYCVNFNSPFQNT